MIALNVRKLFTSGFFVLLLLLGGLQQTFAAKEVDINHANISTIAESLDGIGEFKAQAIVDYRQKHGPFTTLQDLAAVKGVGEKTLQKNAKYIVIK
ncbi:MAG: helix-hairpin-helix domain-containing protein [Pseudomonadales bacterium]|nr:helix-hairpin-helix domain-containing protein [Pseudomonadales bacterium]